MNPKTVHVLITGRVQGVGFRSWTAATARALGLQGWVRNLSGGEVEAMFSGPEAIVNDMLKKCEKGPLAARVTKVEVSETNEILESPIFTTLPTR